MRIIVLLVAAGVWVVVVVRRRARILSNSNNNNNSTQEAVAAEQEGSEASCRLTVSERAARIAFAQLAIRRLLWFFFCPFVVRYLVLAPYLDVHNIRAIAAMCINIE